MPRPQTEKHRWLLRVWHESDEEIAGEYTLEALTFTEAIKKGREKFAETSGHDADDLRVTFSDQGPVKPPPLPPHQVT